MMNADALDATQALALSDVDEVLDQDTPLESEKSQVGNLIVHKHKSGFEATVIPIYEGKNVIGRTAEKCDVHIPVKPLSKQHACIEIHGSSCVLYDMGSRNRTKRRDLSLEPWVRYELQHNDGLTFADVTSQFQLLSKERIPSGSESETDSESMFNMQPPGGTSVASKELQALDSQVYLQPTQAYASDGTGPISGSAGSSIEQRTSVDKDGATFVADTPYRQPGNVVVLSDSDPRSNLLAKQLHDVFEQPTQAFPSMVEDSDVEAEENDLSILDAPTKLCIGGDSETDHSLLFAAETQRPCAESANDDDNARVADSDEASNEEASPQLPTALRAESPREQVGKEASRFHGNRREDQQNSERTSEGNDDAENVAPTDHGDAIVPHAENIGTQLEEEGAESGGGEGTAERGEVAENEGGVDVDVTLVPGETDANTAAASTESVSRKQDQEEYKDGKRSADETITAEGNEGKPMDSMGEKGPGNDVAAVVQMQAARGERGEREIVGAHDVQTSESRADGGDTCRQQPQAGLVATSGVVTSADISVEMQHAPVSFPDTTGLEATCAENVGDGDAIPEADNPAHDFVIAETQDFGNGVLVVETQDFGNGDLVVETQDFGNGDLVVETQDFGNGDLVVETQDFGNGHVVVETQDFGNGDLVVETQMFKEDADNITKANATQEGSTVEATAEVEDKQSSIAETGATSADVVTETGAATDSIVVEKGAATAGTVVEKGAATAGTMVETGAATAGTVVETDAATAGTLVETDAATDSTVVETGAATAGTVVETGASTAGTMVETGAATADTMCDDSSDDDDVSMLPPLANIIGNRRGPVESARRDDVKQEAPRRQNEEKREGELPADREEEEEQEEEDEGHDLATQAYSTENDSDETDEERVADDSSLPKRQELDVTKETFAVPREPVSIETQAYGAATGDTETQAYGAATGDTETQAYGAATGDTETQAYGFDTEVVEDSCHDKSSSDETLVMLALPGLHTITRMRAAICPPGDATSRVGTFASREAIAANDGQTRQSDRAGVGEELRDDSGKKGEGRLLRHAAEEVSQEVAVRKSTRTRRETVAAKAWRASTPKPAGRGRRAAVPSLTSDVSNMEEQPNAGEELSREVGVVTETKDNREVVVLERADPKIEQKKEEHVEEPQQQTEVSDQPDRSSQGGTTDKWEEDGTHIASTRGREATESKAGDVAGKVREGEASESREHIPKRKTRGRKAAESQEEEGEKIDISSSSSQESLLHTVKAVKALHNQDETPARTRQGRKVSETRDEAPARRTRRSSVAENQEVVPAQRTRWSNVAESQEEVPARRTRRSNVAESQEEVPARMKRGRKTSESREEVPTKRVKGEKVTERQEEVPARDRRGRKAVANQEEGLPITVEESETAQGEEPIPAKRTRGRKVSESNEESSPSVTDMAGIQMEGSTRRKRGRKTADSQLEGPTRATRGRQASESLDEGSPICVKETHELAAQEESQVRTTRGREAQEESQVRTMRGSEATVKTPEVGSPKKATFEQASDSDDKPRPSRTRGGGKHTSAAVSLRARRGRRNSETPREHNTSEAREVNSLAVETSEAESQESGSERASRGRRTLESREAITGRPTSEAESQESGSSHASRGRRTLESREVIAGRPTSEAESQESSRASRGSRTLETREVIAGRPTSEAESQESGSARASRGRRTLESREAIAGRPTSEAESQESGSERASRGRRTLESREVIAGRPTSGGRNASVIKEEESQSSEARLSEATDSQASVLSRVTRGRKTTASQPDVPFGKPRGRKAASTLKAVQLGRIQAEASGAIEASVAQAGASHGDLEQPEGRGRKRTIAARVDDAATAGGAKRQRRLTDATQHPAQEEVEGKPGRETDPGTTTETLSSSRRNRSPARRGRAAAPSRADESTMLREGAIPAPSGGAATTRRASGKAENPAELEDAGSSSQESRKRGKPTKSQFESEQLQQQDSASRVEEEGERETEQSSHGSTTAGQEVKRSSRRSTRADRLSLDSPSARRGNASSPSLRRSTLHQEKPRVLFTGIVVARLEKVVKHLGGEVVDTINDCTHLVTDKVRRTSKFLCQAARGRPIVNRKWLENSNSAGMFLDHTPHLVKDSQAEKKFKFNLARTLSAAADRGLFTGYNIHVTPGVVPTPDQMGEIIECAGGIYLHDMPRTGHEKTLVVSCEDDRGHCETALNNDIPVVGAEFILSGILQYEVDITSFSLFNEASTREKLPRGRVSQARSKSRK
ncbi:PREDICTED: mediator of DNA damage checkpoint protein 1-like isoform X2 [Priapulus caudatus]|uniref:Mediator of DNA damage checkpoint protein 1 n=1 Tax=Priapulus caudatus TaxID=37621 RepID=A0ABM1DND1_PRICU|nr:PREDICTED: mediator of DNA damage checkpoint protein 1-like isoform X2 [Priapulus caudatus]